MGGGTSNSDDMGSPAESAGFDSEQIKQFAQSTVGSRYSAAEIAALNDAHTYAGGTRYTSGAQRGIDAASQNDITDLAAAFKTWAAVSSASNAAHQKYVDRSLEQPGRDATILAGPQASPNMVMGIPISNSNPFTKKPGA